MTNLIAALLFLVPSTGSSAMVSDSTSTSNAIDVLLFDGYAIYYRTPLSEKTFLRIGLTASANYSDTEDKGIYHDESSYSVTDRKNETQNSSKNHSYALSVGLHSFLADVHGVSFYISVGPVLTYTIASETNESKYISVSMSDIYKSRSKDKKWGVGGLLFFGVHAPVSNTISVVAEYQLSATYSWGNRTTENEYYSSGFSKSKGSGDITGMYYNLSSLKLGVSISL